MQLQNVETHSQADLAAPEADEARMNQMKGSRREAGSFSRVSPERVLHQRFTILHDGNG
jgi:hypothetical protein